MAYHHEGFPFAMEHQSHTSVYFHPQFPAYMHQQPRPDFMYRNYPCSEFADFLPPGMVPDDYDDGSEVSTRPRLTKEQVEVLESQFQAHPKPNSVVKKQLAIQTKLTLPRVANWFQNRRAKAKQQRKQEEYETQQTMDIKATYKSESSLMARKQSISGSSSKTVSPSRSQPTPSGSEVKRELESQSPVRQESAREASWQSLQRALDAAKAAQRQSTQEQVQASIVMPPPGLPRQSIAGIEPQVSRSSRNTIVGTPVDWSNKHDSIDVWSSPPAQSHMGFDFGFDQDVSAPHHQMASGGDTSQQMQQYVVSTDDWASPFSSGTPQPPAEYGSVISPPLSMPVYPSSRRGSGAESLTADFGTFALAGTPPVPPIPLHQPIALRSLDGEVDLASRRKRPRPAALALNPGAHRSRSYGALSSTSPGFRPGPPSGGQLRHSKSTGHSLNAHYAGIRKSSLPQKSPLNIASFAEAEAYKNLMAQQTSASSITPTPATTEIAMASGRQDMKVQYSEDLGRSMPVSDIMSHYKQLQSPPTTPFQPDFMMQTSGMAMPSTASAASQYATFADYTPPYSAGPMTNSTCSWSDAPLHSPDLQGYGSGSFISSLGFNQQDPGFQQWVLPSDNMTEIAMNSNSSEDRKTEFYITEFPGQREEHANVAQKISHQKPKNYVFANTAPSDYDP